LRRPSPVLGPIRSSQILASLVVVRHSGRPKFFYSTVGQNSVGQNSWPQFGFPQAKQGTNFWLAKARPNFGVPSWAGTGHHLNLVDANGWCAASGETVTRASATSVYLILHPPDF
jgi:hypothetical protein